MKNWLNRMLSRKRHPSAHPRFATEWRGCPHSLALANSEGFALAIARQTGSDSVRPCDALAGLYVASAEFEALARYWEGPAGFGWVVFTACGPMDPRLWYWFDFHANLRRIGRKRIFLISSYFKAISPELQEIRRAADDFAARRAERTGSKLCAVPEDLLLAMVTTPGSSLAGKLIESGLDVDRLKRVTDGAERAACPD